MDISHTKKFIFFHIPKNAGTTIYKLIERHLYKRTLQNRIRSYFGLFPRIYNGDLPRHSFARTIYSFLPGDILNEYYKFAFVRNPFDRIISWYFYVRKTENHPKSKLYNQLSFDQFLNQLSTEELPSQYEYVYNDGKLLMDFVGKVENIEEDFRKVADKTGIKIHRIPRYNSSNVKFELSESQQQFIKEQYLIDFSHFDYE